MIVIKQTTKKKLNPVYKQQLQNANFHVKPVFPQYQHSRILNLCPFQFFDQSKEIFTYAIKDKFKPLLSK